MFIVLNLKSFLKLSMFTIQCVQRLLCRKCKYIIIYVLYFYSDHILMRYYNYKLFLIFTMTFHDEPCMYSIKSFQLISSTSLN